MRTALIVLGVLAGRASLAQTEQPPPPAAPEPAAPTNDPAPALAPAPAIEPAPMPVLAPQPDPEADVTGAIGFQMMENARLLDGGRTEPPPTIGLRSWMSDTAGWEAGLGTSVLGDDGDVDYTFNVMVGYLLKLSAYRHLHVFFEPHIGGWVFAPDSGENQLAVNLRLSLGAEIRLGMIELPRVALTTRISAGLDLLYTEDTDIALFGTAAGLNNGLRGLFEGAFGFVIYI